MPAPNWQALEKTDKRMRKIVTLGLATIMAATIGTAANASEPGGCLKYGAAGAVGGHMANHHGVLGAAAGCAAGMYRRHEYRKEARAKAALYDKEHPGSKGTYQQKATAYDVEHSTTPGTMQPNQQQPNAAPQGGEAQPEGAQHL
ncbi:hypothetical protein APT_00447 [Acetobacter pasteurianus NBRC 101655]|uniref:hypothetical protein n=1 Tax=Acetobacter pasteurianus TaxID=438 RepID=UPI0002457882|nr:hypothetical protein [Acetobacter pasteurianus]BAU37529.1 hypothetical protein APT_00447 [Acetobacter pasteurianus NBRC 101655]CCT60032.1 hypothetical protein APA386B_1975 [Acetobacter pasteurianus 386B]